LEDIYLLHMKRSAALDTHLDLRTPLRSGFDEESSLASASLAPRYLVYELSLDYIGTERREYHSEGVNKQLDICKSTCTL